MWKVWATSSGLDEAQNVCSSLATQARQLPGQELPGQRQLPGQSQVDKVQVARRINTGQEEISADSERRRDKRSEEECQGRKSHIHSFVLISKPSPTTPSWPLLQNWGSQDYKRWGWGLSRPVPHAFWYLQIALEGLLYLDGHEHYWSSTEQLK